MEENYNLTLLIIANEPIELSDLFERASKAEINGLKLEPPEVKMSNAPGALMITAGNPSFRFEKIINGYDLLIFNVIHSNAKRGCFQIDVQNTRGLTVSQELYHKLWGFVQSLNYKNIYAFEIGIRFIIDHQRYPPFKLLNNLQTMKDPKFACIRIIDGDLGEKDLREEFISEIRVETLSQPMKSQVSSVYRFKEYEEDKLQKIFNDIDSVIGLVK